MATALDWVVVDRNERKGEKPSDHAPLVAEFVTVGLLGSVEVGEEVQ